MQEFFPEVSLPTQLNHLNQNCFASKSKSRENLFTVRQIKKKS